MDITNFMTWFVSQVVNIFTWLFNLLDSITMFGFSILDLLIAALILLPIGIQLFLAVIKTSNNSVDRSVRSTLDKKKGSDSNAQNQSS